MPVRSRYTLLWLVVSVLAACSGGGGSTPTSPSPPPTPDPIPQAAAGATLSQNGCAVTYACPNVDANGNANPTTPTFDRLTVMNGTSSSCTVNIGPNAPPVRVPIEFTIRNPSNRYTWSGANADEAHLAEPTSGSAATAGPFQSTVEFFGRQGAVSGDTITKTLTLQLRGGTDNSFAASCAVTMWGFMVSQRG